MNRDDVLAFACGALCLQVDSILPLATQGVSVCITHEPPHKDDLVTWLAKNSRFLTLLQTHHGTRVYDHADDLLYHAGPHTQLPKNFPENHALLCQAVWDKLPDGKHHPRLLVTDLVLPAIPCPRERGEVLRKLQPLFPPSLVLQWSGERDALQSFVDAGSVPHAVECLVALRGPLELVRGPASGIAALDALRQLL